MNSIFKTRYGYHIDLSKIVSISPIYENSRIYEFYIEFQLRDKPLYISSVFYDAQDKFFTVDKETPDGYNLFNDNIRQEILDAWEKYNTKATEDAIEFSSEAVYTYLESQRQKNRRK